MKKIIKHYPTTDRFIVRRGYIFVLGVHPRYLTKYSELEGVDSQIYRTFLWSESNILGGICPTWEYDRWYTFRDLYVTLDDAVVADLYSSAVIVDLWALVKHIAKIYASQISFWNYDTQNFQYCVDIIYYRYFVYFPFDV